jgi:serine protease Do
MTRLCFTLFCSALLYCVTTVQAMPSDALVHQLDSQVLRVQVALANGNFGLGSAVVISKNQVVTNCHVVANACNIVVVNSAMPLSVSAIKPDWRHDLCILKVDGLDAPIAKIGSSKNLKYEQSVFTIGYPNFAAIPVSTFGVVKGLFPLDDSVIIRANSTFGLGASGGGVFDDNGNLVGVITLKSPGREAYYYDMPVEWVQALLKSPEQAIGAKSEPPFWAVSYEKWPYFMQVVHPYLTENWGSLLQIASKWTKKEPNTAEAWYYLAAAEYATNDTQRAEVHLQKVVAMNHQHSQAIYYLGLLAEKGGRHTLALTKVKQLNNFDETTAGQLKLAMETNVVQH